MNRILVVEVAEEQHEAFIKRLPYGSKVIFDFPLPWNKADGPTLEPVWFDRNSGNWNPPHLAEYNWLFLRQQQNWCNDILRARGHIFLNEIYSTLGLPRTSAGQVLGWVYTKDVDSGDNFVDFGCWNQEDASKGYTSVSEAEPETVDEKLEAGAIKLVFNVNGPILQLLTP